MNVYEENGFKDREAYLEYLCEDFDSEMVYTVAELLGEDEDFDGLVTSLEDLYCRYIQPKL